MNTVFNEDNYWESRYKQETKRADENLRLAAERASEIEKLRAEVKNLQEDLAKKDELLKRVQALYAWEKKARKEWREIAQMTEREKEDLRGVLKVCREALHFGLRCIYSHQIYDRDVQGEFERALAASQSYRY